MMNLTLRARRARLLLIAAGLGALMSAAALADGPRVPSVQPKSWKTECAGCHVAYPPALLDAPGWRAIMSGLDRHFGTDAALTPAEVSEITGFLVRNASTQERHQSASQPPRITTTPWFERKHRELPQAVWLDPRIKTRANCAACHTRAEQFSYSEREIRVPGMEGSRW